MSIKRAITTIFAMKRRSAQAVAVAVVAVLALALCGAALRADEPTLDELLKIKPPAPKPATDGPGSKLPTDRNGKPLPLDPNLPRELSAAEAADAFRAAVTDMDKAAGRLRQELDPGLVTQRIQESILLRLDQVIAAAKQQQQQQQSSSSSSAQQQDTGSKQNQGKQQQQQAQRTGSVNSTDQGRKGKVAPHKQGGSIDELRAEWGSLPARLRNELIQSQDEKFSPPYRSLTEAYYRRLAEEGR